MISGEEFEAERSKLLSRRDELRRIEKQLEEMG